MLDITHPEHVEVRISADAKVLWINIDGTCRLRACRIETLELCNETTGVNEVCYPYRDPHPVGAA